MFHFFQDEDTKSRTKWSDSERKAIEQFLMPSVIKEGKPPTQKEILSAMSKSDVLAKRSWKSIKYRTWALFQKQKKQNKDIVQKLLKKN